MIINTFLSIVHRAAHVVVSNLTLLFTDAPVFNKGNDSMEVTLGGNVTFNCSAKGNPDIKIMWKYNLATNVKVTTGGSNIVSITEATSTNAGVYLCTASNTIGTVTRSVTLRGIIIIIISDSIQHLWKC